MHKIYKTERLLLSPLAIADASFIKELVNTPGWIRFIGDRNVKTDADALAYVEKIINSNDICYWVVKLQSAITAIGVISFIKDLTCRIMILGLHSCLNTMGMVMPMKPPRQF